MAITATQRNDVINLLVGMFDAAPSAALMTGFVGSIEAGATLDQLANELAATTEFTSLYPVWLTDDEFATNFVTNLFDGNSPAGLAAGIDIVKGMLATMTRGSAANAATEALKGVPVTDAVFGAAAQGLLNKVDVATYFATTKLTAASDFASLRAVVANVDASSESVSNQKMLIDAALDSFAQNLTLNQDNLKGSAGNDAFTAWIFNNENTAQSGDMIDGGAGSDSLFAEIGNSQAFAISLKTNSVETAYFRVQSDDETDDSDNDIQDGADDGIDGRVQIDAQDMVGTTAFWSTDARANLAIEDVRNNSHQTTLGWRNADAGDVNYEVYFDTQHITKPDGNTSGSQLFLEVLDLESMENGTGPLTNSPYNGLSFTIDGVRVEASGPVAFQTTYADLVAGLNGALAAAGLTTITASLGNSFSRINAFTGNSFDGTTIVLTNTGPEALGTGGWTTPTGELPSDNNTWTRQSTVAPETTDALTQVDIIFDNIGRGSKSEDFVAGNISQGANSGSQGIQQFNIQVDRNSWVDTVRSTNNTLEVVNLENIGDAGSIQIDDLNDVRLVNASTMTGAVTLDVDLTEAVIAKYLDLQDTANNGADDNISFTYILGSNDDSLTLKIEEEAAAHEDFELLVSTGAGNDYVATDLVDTGALDLDTNWLDDQQTLDNLVISTGAGDDEVWTVGEGDFTIATGAGNDTVYTNNDGNLNSSTVTNEIQTITFTAAGEIDTQGSIIVDGVTVALASGDSAIVVAQKVQAALVGSPNFDGAGGAVVDNGDGTVTFTFDNAAMGLATATGGDIAPIAVTATLATDATATQSTSGAAGVDATAATAEVTNVTLAAPDNAIGETIIFDGTTITLADTDGSGVVERDEAAAQVVAGTYTNFTVTDFDLSAGVVQFTANTAGALADLAAGSITGTADAAAGEAYTNAAPVGTNVTTGIDGTAAVAVTGEGQDILTFTAADFTGSFLITADTDGDNAITVADTTAVVALTAGDSAITVASKAAAAMTAAFGASFTVAHVANTATVTVDYAASLGSVAEAVSIDGALKGAPTVVEDVTGDLTSPADAAQWVVNSTNTEVDDLRGTTPVSSLLYGATLTVTFSGASIEGDSGVTDGDAVALANGFEKSVTVSTVDNLGNEININQAIKDAILNDDVLQEFLTVKDGPANTLIIESLVDGRFDEDDLQINLTAATVSSLASTNVTSLKATLNDINNTSNATVTDGALQTALDAAVATYATSNVLTKFAMGTDVAGVQIQGNASVTESDNVISLGSGDNVVVLGTDATSNDVIVISETFGEDSVLNFVTTGAGLDLLHFGTYLGTETSVSGSAASAVTVAATLTSVTAASGDTVSANEVTIINDFVGTSTESFAGLTATTLLAAVNSSNSGGAANWANITENTLEAAGTLANVVGATRDHIVMVENEANDGEYKVFHLVSNDNNTNGDFASATLIGTLDFGNELTGMTATNITLG